MTFNSIKQQGTSLSPEMIREYEEVLEKYNEEVLNGSAGNFQTTGYDPDDGSQLVFVGSKANAFINGMKDMANPLPSMKSTVAGMITDKVFDLIKDEDSLYKDSNMGVMKEKFMYNGWAFGDGEAQKMINGEMYRAIIGTENFNKYIDSPLGFISSQFIPNGVMQGSKSALAQITIQKLDSLFYENNSEKIAGYVPKSGEIITIYTSNFDPQKWENSVINNNDNWKNELQYGKDYELYNLRIDKQYEKPVYYKNESRSVNDIFINKVREEQRKMEKAKRRKEKYDWEN
jgi:hypothetical protein